MTTPNYTYAQCPTNRYTLCAECDKAERKGEPAKQGCRGMALYCKDRQGPAVWNDNSFIIVYCFTAQIARNGDATDPVNKAQIDECSLRYLRGQNKLLAQKFYNYMTFRTAREGVPHEMNVEQYEHCLDYGLLGYRGVMHNGCDITNDTQKPELWQEWSAATVATTKKN